MKEQDYDPEGYAGIIHHVIKLRYYRTTVEYDELFSIGYIGWLKAMKKFNPEKCKGNGYVYKAWHIRNEIDRYLTTHNNYNNSQCEYVDEISDTSSSPDDSKITTDNTEYEVLKEDVRRAIAKFKPKHKYVLQRVLLDDDEPNLAEVARELELSTQRVSQIYQVAIRQVRDEINR